MAVMFRTAWKPLIFLVVDQLMRDLSIVLPFNIFICGLRRKNHSI